MFLLHLLTDMETIECSKATSLWPAVSYGQVTRQGLGFTHLYNGTENLLFQ